MDKIREALHIYLNAPGAKDFQTQVANSNDIAVWQWKANVSHLESQIQLANSVLQAKEVTIQALQLSNYIINQKIETKDSKKDDEKEDLIPGLVRVGTLSIYGFDIHLGEFLKILKRKFK